MLLESVCYFQIPQDEDFDGYTILLAGAVSD